MPIYIGTSILDDTERMCMPQSVTGKSRMLEIMFEGPPPRKGRNVKVGSDVILGPGVILYDNVTIERNVVLGPNVIVGEPLLDVYGNPGYENPKTVIKRDSIVRSGTVIYAGCVLGPHLSTGHHAVLRERTICGDSCSFGTYSSSDGDVVMGNRCRLHYFAHICKNSKVGDDVWLFPCVMTLTDQHPPCGKCAKGPTIKDRAIIGAAALIMPALTIGEDAVVAAGTMVTKDVPPGKLVAGQPGMILGKAANLRCTTGLVKQPYPWIDHYQRTP